MGTYKVKHNYASVHDGRRLGPWKEGDIVEIDDVDADHIENDSPGAIKATKKKADADPSGEGNPPVEVLPEGTLEEQLAWVAEPAEQSERAERANALWAAESAKDGFDEAALSAELQKAVYGDGEPEVDVDELKGEALAAALEEYELDKTGTADEKRARVAEYLKAKAAGQ